MVVGPKTLDAAFARIRSARDLGHKTPLDYRGALSDYDLGDRGFVDFPSVVWRAQNGAIEKFVGFTASELQHAWDQPGPACKR